ncbi:Aminoacylase-1 [Taenia solium]
MNGNDLALGSVVTLNINVIKGGIEPNIVPGEIEVQVDFCVPPTLDFAAFERQIYKWADESGTGTKVSRRIYCMFQFFGWRLERRRFSFLVRKIISTMMQRNCSNH